MAAPVLAKVISVRAKGSATAGEFVIIRNLKRGGQLTAALTGTGDHVEVIFNPAPTTAWQEKDLIQAEVRGRIQGVAQKNIKDGSATITITTTTDTSTPGMSL